MYLQWNMLVKLLNWHKKHNAIKKFYFKLNQNLNLKIKHKTSIRNTKGTNLLSVSEVKILRQKN